MNSTGVITINFDEPEVKVNSNVSYEKTERTSAKMRIPTNDSNEPKTVNESKSYLRNLMQFVSTDNFERLCAKWEGKTGFSKKKIAENFFQRILGTIGDFGCIGCDTFESAVKNFISIMSSVLKLVATMIVKVAKAAFRLITLNYTRG